MPFAGGAIQLAILPGSVTACMSETTWALSSSVGSQSAWWWSHSASVMILPSGEAFPAQLQAALRAEGWDVTVINGGNSGDTTAAGRSRLDWALSDDPDLVLVTLGVLYGLRFAGELPAAIEPITVSITVSLVVMVAVSLATGREKTATTPLSRMAPRSEPGRS